MFTGLIETVAMVARVDAVQLYVAPVSLGAEGVPFLDGRAFVSTELVERRVDLLGPDVLIEGYVHRPH